MSKTLSTGETPANASPVAVSYVDKYAIVTVGPHDVNAWVLREIGCVLLRGGHPLAAAQWESAKN